MSSDLSDRQPPAVPTGLSRRQLLGAAALGAAGAFVPTLPGTAAPREVSLPQKMQPSPALARANDLVSFRSLRGVPVHYWRAGQSSATRTWHAKRSFLDQLNRWMADLQRLSRNTGYGDVASLVSAGFYVNRSGQHGNGTAMDLDVVTWSGGRTCSPYAGDHASSSRGRRRRYLAIDALLRRRFRYVLDGRYNAAHQDHMHADFGGTPVGRLLTGSRSDTVFMQAVCNQFMGAGLANDGIWGPRTQAAVAEVQGALNVSGSLAVPANGRLLLIRIARKGMRNQSI